MTPRVSVVLPTLNRAEILRGAIRSVLDQTFGDLELLVVDDGSDDDIAAVCASFNDSRLRCLRRDTRGGVAAARNTGVAAACGEWIAFQDSDDEWLLDKLDVQLDATRFAPGKPDLVICGLLRVSGAGVRRYPARQAAGRQTYLQTLGTPIAYTQTWLVRREALVGAGPFNAQLRIWDDWEMLLRLTHSRDAWVVPDAQVVSPSQPDSISRDRERFRHDMDLILRLHAEALKAHPSQHAGLQHVYARLLAGTGRLAEARQACIRALRLQPSRWRSAALLASACAGQRLTNRVLGIDATSGGKQ